MAELTDVGARPTCAPAIGIRSFRMGDSGACARVFGEAIRGIASQHYTADQLAAWQACGADAGAFGAARLQGITLVAEAEGYVVAFGQLHPGDHVEMLYCAPEHAGRGIGSRLLGELIQMASTRGARVLTADVSLSARSVFERAGFRVVAEEVVERHGVGLPRLRMKNVLPAQ